MSDDYSLSQPLHLQTGKIQPWVWTLFGIALAMLLATLFYPFGYDQIVFTIGGETILKHGALPYRDFLDTKPPIIFYLYLIPSFLFGHHEYTIRIFDLIYQAATHFYFYRLLCRMGDRQWALVTVSVSAMLYAASGFWMTAQAESFALLPGLAFVDLLLRSGTPQRELRYGILAGIVTGLLFLLKFTLVLGPIAGILWLVLRDKPERASRAKYLVALAAGAIATIALYALHLVLSGAFQHFIEGVAWVSRYSAIEPLFSKKTIAERFYLLFPDRLMTTFSLTFFMLGTGALAFYLRQISLGERSPFLGLFAMVWCFHLLGVAIERKEFQYHYSRSFWAFSPFIAVGLQTAALAIHRLFERVRSRSLVTRTVALGLTTLAMGICLFFSPLVKIFAQTIPWISMAARGEDARAEVHRNVPDYFADEQFATGTYVARNMSVEDNLFVWGNDVGVYFYANRTPTTLCLTATPLRTAWTPQSWKDQVMREITMAPPKYFVVEFGDTKEYLTGDPSDSYTALQSWTELASFVNSRYIPDTTIGHFYVYRRK